MQAADNVELGHGFTVAGSCRLERLFKRHRVGAGRVFLSAKGAQTAGGDADVRRIDVAVYVEVSLVAMPAFAHVIGQPADSKDVPGLVKHQRIAGAEAFAGQHLRVNSEKARVVGLKRVHSGHLFDDTSARQLMASRTDQAGAERSEIAESSPSLTESRVVYAKWTMEGVQAPTRRSTNTRGEEC